MNYAKVPKIRETLKKESGAKAANVGVKGAFLAHAKNVDP
jgi:hypothetical protein